METLLAGNGNQVLLFYGQEGVGLKPDPMRCGGDRPHRHLTMWATSTAHHS